MLAAAQLLQRQRKLVSMVRIKLDTWKVIKQGTKKGTIHAASVAAGRVKAASTQSKKKKAPPPPSDEGHNIKTEIGPWIVFMVKSNAVEVQRLVVPWFIAMYGLSYAKSLKLDVIKVDDQASGDGNRA